MDKVVAKVELDSLIEKVIDECKNGHCKLASCRYNGNGGICQNLEKRKECMEVSMAVLCLED